MSQGIATPEDDEARLQFLFSVTNAIIGLHRLTRSVQIPCRFFL
jgi:hypothetical protein